MSQVILERVSKYYVADRRSEPVYAVRELSMEIAQGEFLVLLGPSGCGKSTTLRLIAGLEEISEGTLRMGGKVVNDVEPKDRDIAMVFQNYALYPHMTVRQNMSFGLELRKMDRKEIDRRVESAAVMLNLSALLHRLPKELSGGQRQRVAVGRAIVRQPQVFLFDEPLSNLDAQMRTQMRTELTRLHRDLKATMIYVTHDQTEAMTMGDRIAVMNNGQLQQWARPTELYEKPANLFVAGFVGTPPMNFFEGRIGSKEGRPWFTESSEDGGNALNFPLPALNGGKRSMEAGKRVIAGFRAEHLNVGRKVGEADCAFRGTVELVERLGAETLVHIRRGEHRCTVRASATCKLALDETCEVAAHSNDVRLFDAETGAAME